MSPRKPPRAPRQPVDIVRSPAAECLTDVSAVGDEPEAVEVRYEDQNIWLTQKPMATLCGVAVGTVSEHRRRIFETTELKEGSAIRESRIAAADGKTRETRRYGLQANIAVGSRAGGERAVQFRKWASQIVKEYTIKGFATDDERPKAGGSILGGDFFDEQVQRVREIRLSERRLYQKVADIYATSVDYDATAQATKRVSATVQNKLHWATRGRTAAEVIVSRADAEQEHMGLTTWHDAPAGEIQRFDVVVAKNHLSAAELDGLGRLVSPYLDLPSRWRSAASR